MAVDAVVYYRVSNATISVVNVEDAARSTRLLAQTTLRTVLGTKNLSEILSDRENISHFMQVLHSPLSVNQLHVGLLIKRMIQCLEIIVPTIGVNLHMCSYRYGAIFLS